MKRKYKVYSVLRNLSFVALGVGACALLCGGTFYVFDRDAEKLYYHYSTN